MKILVKPLEGIYWENKSILIGEKRGSVENTFSNTDIRKECIHNSGLSFFVFKNDLRVDFDSNDCVEFIEFLGGLISELQPLIYDVDIFKTNADKLFELLKRHNAGEIGDSENGYCYDFKNISVGIYRESTPQSLAEFIEEIRNDSSIDEKISEENIREETLKANYWATLGIGTKNYYL